ncbi:family 43 glycosylhydrolase [Bacteroidota bacterium]
MNIVHISTIRRKIGIIAFFLLIAAGSNYAQETFQNPILPGYHPDPSICRVGDDYYLVNSTFEWFPGMPIHHSKDLVNWELIGYGIHRPEQLELQEGLGDYMGVFAVTIRHHDGVFYLINTCVQCKKGGNFYITATDPAGPWSDPVWLDAPGIDPSLMWDDDGKCYYVGHGNLSGKQAWPDQQGAWLQELDLEQGRLVGRREQLTFGHANNAVWTEGPHLYKIKGKYMLIVAEGGTGFNHSTTVHHSDSIWGPYIADQVNPVLTHRHLGRDYPVHSIGHTDLVQTQKGDWWAVMLGKRYVDGYTLLARETFLTPVVFEGQTPVFNPGIGIVQLEQERPDLPWSPVEEKPARDEFDDDELDLEWNMLRTPYTEWYKIEDGKLSIDLRKEVLDSLVNPSLIARRIEHHNFSASMSMNFSSAKKNEQAGMILYRRSTCHYQFLKEKNELVMIKTKRGEKTEVARVKYKHDKVILAVKGKGRELNFSYGPSEKEMKPMGDTQDTDVISFEIAEGFNGPYLGMYATSNGVPSKEKASFEWFEYRSGPEDGFTVLFDGTNLDDWIGNKQTYKVEDGMIAVRPDKGGGGNLYTKEQYKDFIFRFEFKLTEGANNGLGIRTPTEGDAAFVGMELQILDNPADEYKDLESWQYHGSVYGVIPALRGYLKPTGEWNTQEVLVDGTKIKITLNGHVILDGDIGLYIRNRSTIDGKKHPGLGNEKGHIGFLGHGHVLWFRNISIKEL